VKEERLIYIDFLQCFRAILQKWKLILAVASVGILVAGVATYFLAGQEDVYQGTSSVYCVAEGSYTQTAETVQMMNIYVDIIQSSRVAERANSILGNAYPDANTILRMIAVDTGEEKSIYYSTISKSSIVIKISAQSTNVTEAINVANAMAEAFSLEMSSMLSNTSVQVLDSAETTEVVYEAEKQNILYIALGAAAGFFLAAAWIAIKEIFVINLHSVNDGTLFGKLDVIGVIPYYSQK